ncbi:peptide chain release factor N(5)-glutamine methyltransferase [Opitutaceae bacterium EW11]|nr:peptide chain release factor N(5)-glutamine methyltransferase [Opitutaceae bacterium EW11]
MLTVLEIIKKTTDFLGSKGVENPRLNSELLVGHALGLKRMQLYIAFERPLSEPELEKIRPLVRRRAQREPLQYIVGEVEWGGLKLKADRRALIPRPETEYLIELVTASGLPAPARILDLGTGSGAIALGLAKAYPESRVVAVDRSEDALALARENAAATGLTERVEFRQSNWFSAISAEESFDLIAANPPYLSSSETAETAPEVRSFEPVGALVAEGEGTSDLREIVRSSPSHLRPGGMLAMETGIHQHAVLLAACAEAGFARSESKQDLTNRDRYILAWK